MVLRGSGRAEGAASAVSQSLQASGPTESQHPQSCLLMSPEYSIH